MIGSSVLTVISLFLLLLLSTSSLSVSADTDEQEALAKSTFELLEDMPWWIDVDNVVRRLENGDASTNETTMAVNNNDAAVRLEQPEPAMAKSIVRRAQGNGSLVTVTSGFCLPMTATRDSGTCRSENQQCTSQSLCCRGLTCQSGRCKPICRRAGNQCSNDESCCSKQCVLCNSACQGRCGLGQALPKDDIQIFYYPWYASQSADGFWRHWAMNGRPGGGAYDPSHDDIPSNFYPRLGPYSSRSLDVLNKHMEWIARANIGTIVVSWWGKGSYEDELMPQILNIADDWGLKVAFYIEPYGGGYVRRDPSTGKTVGSRTPQTAMADVMFLIDRYGCHRALYRRDGRPVFMFFAARTYNGANQTEWKQVWNKLHANPNYNPVVIAHDTNLDNRIIAGGWDGGHDYGTKAAYDTSSNWKRLASTYAAAGKTFYFTVSPGYATRVQGPVVDRQDGQLYKSFWMRATAAKKDKNPVIITSFNEYHEGSQIEPSMPKSFESYRYLGENRDGYTYDDFDGAWGLTGEAAACSYIDYTRKYSRQYRNA